MRRNADFVELAAALRTRTDLLEAGLTERGIAHAVTHGQLRRVRKGWYVDEHLLSELWDESRHLLHVIAVARDARTSSPVFGYVSAAVLWGLPTFGARPRRVHVMAGSTDRRSYTDVMRHEGELLDSDVSIRHGILCTTLERTVADLARTASWESGVVAADAALQQIAGPPRDHDLDSADE